MKEILPHLDNFLLNLKTNNYSEETLYNYERDLNLFSGFISTELRVPFDQITKHEIALFKAHLTSHDRKASSNANKSSNTTLSARSINRMLSALRSYLTYLIDQDIPCPIPPDAVTMVRTERLHPRVAELEDLVRLIEAPSNIEKNKFVALRNRTMLELLFSTGMRISELITLKVNQLDNTGKIFIKGKGKKERFVYMTPRAISHVEKYLKERVSENPYLFIPMRGKNARLGSTHVSTNYLQSKIKQYRDILQISVPTSAHSLRHGFATYLAEQGANPAAIQTLLGHESLDTTSRYVHPSDRFAEKTHRNFHPLRKNKKDSTT